MENLEVRLKSLKHAKIRGKYIQVHACINNVRYRFSTRKRVSAKNLLWVEANYKMLIDQHILETEQNNNIGVDIATYGREILELHCEQRKENTYIRYLNVFKKYIRERIGHLEVAHIKPKNAREIFAKFNDVSSANRGIILNLLKLIFNHAVYDEITHANPFTHLKVSIKKVPKEDKNKPFTQKEIGAILSNCDNEVMRLYLYIAFFTGMRPNEILALHVRDIDLDLGVISVTKALSNSKIDTTKTNTTRCVEITLALKQYLLSVLGNINGYLFLGAKGFLKEKKIAYNFQKILNKLSIEKNTLYSTRHTFASLMLQSGEDMLWISNQLGHKDIGTTLKYYVKYVKQNKNRGLQFDKSIMEEVA